MSTGRRGATRSWVHLVRAAMRLTSRHIRSVLYVLVEVADVAANFLLRASVTGLQPRASTEFYTFHGFSEKGTMGYYHDVSV